MSIVGLASVAAAFRWTRIELRHRFGHLTSPDAIVAHVDADGVGFEELEEGPSNGPWSFDVAPDGSIWLLDQFDSRLLEWDPNEPHEPTRTVRYPADEIRVAADLAIGGDGTIYLSYLPESPPDDRQRLMVCALSPRGRLRWTAQTDLFYFNDRIRIAPDGALYWEGTLVTDDDETPGTWTPVTSPDGRPLSLQEQRAGATPYQPMPGGSDFEAEQFETGDALEWRFTLRDADDHVAAGWTITSDDELGGMIDEPGIVAGVPVVTLGIARQTPLEYRYEYVVVPLPTEGTVTDLRHGISLDPDAAWGESPTTGIRIGPDGALYQLRTDPDEGVSIARYDLLRAASSPSPTESPSVTVSPSPTITPSPTAPAEAASGPSDWILAFLVVAIALGGGTWWLVRRSRT